MLKWLGKCILCALLGFWIPNVFSQAHYPAGVEGIKCATLPSPGLYTRVYTVFYTGSEFDDGPPWFNRTDVVVFVPRLIWISDWKLFGANYGMDVLVPMGYVDVDHPPAGLGRSSGWSMGDTQLGLVLLGWHFEGLDIAAGYALWVPMGSYHDVCDLGKGFWGHMVTLGTTFYPDQEKAWAISVLNRYELNHEHRDLDVTPGHVWTVEWGVSRVVKPGMELGGVGYFQWQTTGDSGSQAVDVHEQVMGLGPELVVQVKPIGVMLSLRYNYELLAHGRTEGHNFTLTLTKRL